MEGLDFSPDGKPCLIAVGSATYASARLLYSRSEDGAWTSFAEPPFIAGFVYSNEPVFLGDGKTLQFTGTKRGASKDLWTVSYSDSGWGQPMALPEPINSGSDEFCVSYLGDGTLHFASERSGIKQVYKASPESSEASVVSLVGPPISIERIEADPCIAPDGGYLVSCPARTTGARTTM